MCGPKRKRRQCCGGAPSRTVRKHPGSVIPRHVGADAFVMVALLKMPRKLVPGGNDDRRMFPRKEVHAEVQANRVDHTLVAHRQPKVTLALRDLSLGGLSALSPMPLQEGERLAVHFPQIGPMGAWDAVGRVLRCVPSALGYRVSVEFDPLPAA